MAQRLAEVDGLGTMHAVHGAGRIPKVCLTVAAVVLVVTVVVALADGGSAGTVLGTLAFGLLCALVAATVALVFRPLRKVGVYDGGFAVAEWGRVRAWRWDDVVSISSLVQRRRAGVLGIPLISVMAHQHRLLRADGRKLTLTHGLRGVGDVVETINSAVMPRIARQALDTLRAGGTVAFGAVTLHPTGVHGRRRSLPWARLAEPEIADGVLTLRDVADAAKPIVSTCQRITNVHALLLILRTASTNRPAG